MLRALTRDWNRVRNEAGNLVYVVNINDFSLCNVYREGSHWLFLIVMIPEEPFSHRPVIVEHGSGATKNEAQWLAEQKLPPSSQEELGW